MITQYTHYGLIFTAQDVTNAQTHRAQAPYAGAWAQFESLSTDTHTLSIPYQHSLYNALRWRLLNDVEAGARALESLPMVWEYLCFVPNPIDVWVLGRFGAIQTYECLRDHPAYEPKLHDPFKEMVYEWIREGFPTEQVTVKNAWWALVKMAAGVAFEDSELIETTAIEICGLIDTIHPAGYIPSVIQTKPDDTANFRYTVSTIHALTLAAEVALHVGIDLWAHQKRTVSLMTTAFYPLYYYYYPEKWKWAEGLTFEMAQGAIRQARGYLEIVNRRRPNVHAVNMILKELRPVINVSGGGALTLTHNPAPPPKRGWFNRG